ncbi:MAG TPA: SDR family oxidoreductase [Thermomicrobiales bacterium]|nr:SDR family oxidoreductase [Thermomicrobiales bacterium]
MARHLNEQVIVITGASSGIGRETAIMLGQRGSSVVLAARNEAALHEVAQEVERLGGKALIVVTDVAEWDQVERLVRAAVDHFGRIDTWVNNAAVSEYAPVTDMTIAEIERIIQINLLGQIYGMKAALPHLTRQGQGTIINVASTLAERSVPLQAAYCAAKHGIKGFTEALRVELASIRSGVTVTLILPSSINTPRFEHARSKLGVMPRPIPPIYEPRTVAEAILFAAEHPRRDIVVGGGKVVALTERISPSLLDWYMVRNRTMFDQQRSNRPDDERDNLFAPMDGASSPTGGFGQTSKSVSLYTRVLELHPNRQRALNLGLVVAGLAAIRRFGR